MTRPVNDDSAGGDPAMLSSFLDGAILGLSITAPLGPVSLLCVHRSLAGGARLGLSGLGSATAHGAFMSLAITGAGAVAATLADWRMPIHLASAAILIGLGGGTLWR